MDLVAFFEQDRFASQAGIVLLEVRPGYARAKLETDARHLNAVGTIQGGAIFTLADLALAAAANSRGELAVTVEASISFVKAAKGGVLFAEANEEALGSKLCLCTVRVTEEGGALVALLKGTSYRKRASGG